MAGEVAAHAAEAAHHGVDLVPVVVLLAAGAFAVPLFKRLGLGSVLGYLAAGLVLGPSGLGLISDPANMLAAAELGVVLFLFIIGLEMEPTKLWALRKQIFGLGVVQVAACGALLTGIGILLGFAPAVAFVFGMGFVLTSTAMSCRCWASAASSRPIAVRRWSPSSSSKTLPSCRFWPSFR